MHARTRLATRRSCLDKAWALGIALLIWVPAQAHAGGLVDAWHASRDVDPDLQVARAVRSTGEARAARADTLWRPQVTLSATAGVGRSETTVEGARFSAPPMGTISDASFRTSVQGPTGQFALAVRQPLWNPELSAIGRQIALSAEGANLQWQADTQAAMLRLAERWLGLAVATERARISAREEASLERSLAEATARWRAGDEPVLAMHETAARLEHARALRIAAETDREAAGAALHELTGVDLAASRPSLPGPLRIDRLEPIEQWAERAAAGNPAILAQALAVRVSSEQAARTARGTGASLDLMGRASIDRMIGSGEYAGSAASGATQGVVGVTLSMPLYTGGQRESQHEESIRQLEQSRAELERTRRTVGREVRDAWRRLEAGRARTEAMDRAVAAALQRLASTRTGRDVGDRTALDVLNAENDLAQAELGMAESRVALLLDRLRLARMAGALGESDLAWVDHSGESLAARTARSNTPR